MIPHHFLKTNITSKKDRENHRAWDREDGNCTMNEGPNPLENSGRLNLCRWNSRQGEGTLTFYRGVVCNAEAREVSKLERWQV